MLRILAPMLLASVAIAQDYYSAALEGAQEVPPVATTGRGWSVVRFDVATSTVRVFVHYEGLTGPPIAAHMHQGVVGVNGPIVVGLAASGPNSMSGSGPLTPAQATALATSGMYVNVHTAANPGGEIRGQVVASASTRFTTVMSGSQEVPPVVSTGTGVVVAYLHEPENRIVWMIDSSGLTNVIAAHFHQAPVGVSGPIIVNFGGGAGDYAGVSGRLTNAQVAAFKAGGIYANVHTSANPGGEIRGQMMMDAGDHFVASLAGTQEVPPTPSAGLGRAALILSPNGTLTLTGAFAGTTGPPIAAHVHFAPPGVNGPIVFPIATPGTSLTASFTPNATDLTNLRAGNWYVNIHTAAFPGGEIRAQLVPARLPTTFGEGCPGSNNVRAQIGATGFLSLGSSMSVDLYGGVPFSPALFLFGQSRDLAAGVLPLPIELSSLGLVSPRCYLLIDPVTLLGAATDPLGFSSMPINVPFATTLAGSLHYAQWITFDPLASPSGFIASSAITLRIN
ncbi:MAG TPA: CHRD domain-containing protein [Planctomycetota bacterium]